MALKWEFDNDRSEAKEILEDSNYFCPICSKPKVNTMSSNKRFYHFDCISSWLQKNDKEPNLSSSTPTEFIRYYCLQCGRAYC